MPLFFIPSLHFLYLTNNWQRALQEYSRISEKLPSTNFAMKRDVQEGQARCLVHLGRHMEALEIATNLVSGFIAYIPFTFLGLLNSLFSKNKKQLLASSKISGFG